MMFLIQRYSVLILFLLFISCRLTSSAQCFSSFPYTEDFETSNGNWTTGGSASDWAWGKPSKKIISQAGSGQKCWIIGGLTGSYYNLNEKSWLQSPCFDFTSLKNPYIAFLINWDTETNYDGAGLQYSADNGATWQSAGAYGDPATSCGDNNWFNSNRITYGVQSEGWCGSGRDGSNGWVLAYHSFPKLAGKPNVRLRFVFGAGKTYNDYNGFAVDNIYIGETETEQLSFTYTCTATPKQASFAAAANNCITASTLRWDFDDAVSGAANSASGSNALHLFVMPGSHTVTLTGKNNRNETKTATQTIIIPEVSAAQQSPILCYGGTGTASATVTGTNARLSYSWSTNPVITTSSAQVKAGTYQVTVSAEGGCFDADAVTLDEPGALGHDMQTIPADCNNLNGSISITEDGGTPPYRYAWQGTQYTTPSATNLPSGNYSILVTDNNLCTDKIDVVLPKTPSTLNYSYGTIPSDCGLNNGSITINASGGTPDYTYSWAPGVSTTNSASNIPSGDYLIKMTDKNQCSETATVTLGSVPVSVSLGRDTFVCKGQKLVLRPSGNFTTYNWNDGTSASTKEVTREGMYSVTVTNAGGCIARDTVRVSVGCGDLQFPSVFTPNGDGLNEQFGPSGGLSLVTSYRLMVYNRFGNLVFQSVNPFQKWKGETEGKKYTGAYTYFVTYTFEGEKKMKKGTIVLFL